MGSAGCANENNTKHKASKPKANKEQTIIKILLKDRTMEHLTKSEKEIAQKQNLRRPQGNIIWATDQYTGHGFFDEIEPSLLSLKKIRPRIQKSQKEQKERVRQKAEVFTPSYICNAQNNLVDKAYLGFENAFNTPSPTNQEWTSSPQKIDFSKTAHQGSWQDYVLSNRLEVSCGEAPYLVSRYDTVSGVPLDISHRVGILDRKLRVVGENTTTQEDWTAWAIKAYQSTYGFEWQGDNLFIARKNLFDTFVEYHQDRFGSVPTEALQAEIATIISYNLWQMDGLKGVIPCGCHTAQMQVDKQLTMFVPEEIESAQYEFVPCKGCQKNEILQHNGIYAKIKDWQETDPKKQIIKFVDLLRHTQS